MKINDRVILTEEAVDNYGQEYANIIFIVSHVATKYMPAKEFYKKGMPNGYHPGFDAFSGTELLDLVEQDTLKNLEFSVYEYEVEPA